MRRDDTARCDAFLDRLNGMSRAEWLASGGGHRTPARAEADAALDDLIVQRRLAVTAWLVRDTVETAAHLAHYAALVAPFLALAAGVD